MVVEGGGDVALSTEDEADTDLYVHLTPLTVELGGDGPA